MIKTTANKVIIRRSFVSEPSNNNSLSTSVCANRIAIGGAINNRRKSRAKIEIVHNQKVIFCASKDGTFERENCYVTPLDGLNGRDASRLRAPWLHFTNCIPNKFGEFEDKNSRGRKETLPGVSQSKNFSTKRTGYDSSSLSLLLSTCFHHNQVRG